MALSISIQKIEEKLSELQTGREKLDYLNTRLFDLKKQRTEFLLTDQKELDRLKTKTKTDYDKYMSLIDEGRLPPYFNNDETDQKILGYENILLLRKRLALENQIALINSQIDIFENLIRREKAIPEELNTDLDLSRAKGTEKIIYLHELGILDLLRAQEPFNLSTRQLAVVLSAITGEKTNTLVSYLNPIYSEGANQNNNPLKPERVKKVRAILEGCGYKTK